VIHQHRILEDTVYFWIGSNDTNGSGDDGANPLYDVRLAGAAAGAAPVLSGAGTLLTHANYPDGCHEIAIAATAANGFSAGNTYAVFFSITADGQTPTGFIGSFSLEPIIADVKEWNSTNVATPDTAGHPKVTIKDGAGAGEIALTGGAIDNVTLTDTCTTLTGHTAQTGDNFARLGAPAGASVSADIAENQTDLNTIITDTNELQTDWTNGGRLDLILDAIKAVTDLLPDAGALNDLATILTDTNELQTDWTNGGRLDLLIDAIKAVTDLIPDAGAMSDLGTINTNIGTPANIDAGGATLSDNIKKIADDNGGVDYDATTDSLERLRNTAPIGTAMRGTDSAALASVCTEARLAELGAANLPADIDILLTRITAAVALASVCTEARLSELDAANLPSDLDAVLADTNELQTDWTNSGRLDLILDAILADTGTDGVVVAAASKTGYALSNAGVDAIFERPSSNYEDGQFRSLSGAVSKLVNKVDIVAGTLTVRKSNDTTAHGTQAVTTDAAADPITAVDTA
jgi:hypothetical protein